MKIDSELRLCGDWAPKQCDVETCFEENLLLNIEAPIISKDLVCSMSPLPKAGPSLFNSSFPKTRKKGIAALANNHLFDYSLPGYYSTLHQIQSHGWVSVGAGLTRRSSRRPIIFKWNHKRVAVISRCETQFGVSQLSKPGVAELSLDLIKQIKNLKTKVDIVIVSVHSAAELIPWPSPRRQDEYRMLIECGADIVHGHHAHVPNGWEYYAGGWIFYGLGNFCVDPRDWSWHPNGLWSLSPILTLRQDRIEVTVQTLDIDRHSQTICIRPSNDEEAKEHSRYLDTCNKPLHARKLLEGLWQEASLLMYDQVYGPMLKLKKHSSDKLALRAKQKIAELSHLIRPQSQAKALRERKLMYYHLFACDSHRDAIATALGILSGELEDLRSKETKNMIESLVLTRNFQ
jgi:hypothetical protein